MMHCDNDDDDHRWFAKSVYIHTFLRRVKMSLMQILPENGKAVSLPSMAEISETDFETALLRHDVIGVHYRNHWDAVDEHSPSSQVAF